MKLLLMRKWYTDKSTIGELFINDIFQCFTLEDKVRDIKIPGRTAIFAGTFKIKITFSNRFQKDMPLLLDVPYFSGIRIHSGNTDEDTSGCILVGDIRKKDFIGNSRVAYKRLFKKMRNKDVSDIKITIKDYVKPKKKNKEVVKKKKKDNCIIRFFKKFKRNKEVSK